MKSKRQRTITYAIIMIISNFIFWHWDQIIELINLFKISHNRDT